MNRILPPDDLEIARAQKNDPKALATVLEKTSPYVLNLCKSWCRPPLESEDIAQETLIVVAKKIESYESKSAFFTWVYSVSYRTFLDNLRKESRRSKIAKIESIETTNVARSLESPPPADLANEESFNVLSAALNHLEFQHAQILILIDVKEDSYANVAKDLGIPIGTVRSRLARARISLRKELEKGGTISRRHGVSLNEETK